MQNESNHFKPNLSIDINGFLMDFSTTKIMGIVNLTPDSFFDGGKLNSIKDILYQCELMLSEGADILDLGAFSSRPGAEMVSEEEELKRLNPALKAIKKEFPKAIISIDTYRSEVAKQSVDIGAHIINDISGGSMDPKMFEFIGKNKVPYVLMHMQNQPKNMQVKPNYKNVVAEVYSYFHDKITLLKLFGALDIILDPGFGFGKNLSHNYQLLKHISYFKTLDCPILVGISRKRMIQEVIHEKSEQALNGTTAANTMATLLGAQILRVHDVKEAKEAASIVDFMQKQ